MYAFVCVCVYVKYDYTSMHKHKTHYVPKTKSLITHTHLLVTTMQQAVSSV